MPITYVQGEGGHLRPLPVIEASLRQLRTAGITRCMVITSERKPELAQYLGGGGAIGLDIAYVQQSRAEGLAAAVALTAPWTSGFGQLPAAARHHRAAAGCPEDHARHLRGARRRSGAGRLSHRQSPKELGPVRFDAEMRVTEVQDKPAATDLANSWGLAIWGARFSDMIAAAPAGAESGPVVSPGGAKRAECHRLLVRGRRIP